MPCFSHDNLPSALGSFQVLFYYFLKFVSFNIHLLFLVAV